MPKNLRLDELYDLEDLALETGAAIEFADGRKFNTSKVELKRKKSEPVQPSAARTSSTAETAEILKQIVTLLSRPVEVVIPPMPAPQVTVNLPPKEDDDESEDKEDNPVRWVFEFERNPNGTIKRIEAIPSVDKRQLM